MNIKKYLKTAILILTTSISVNTISFAANTYSDVPQNHWAYSSISKIADEGIMVGDSTNYYPNQVIDKFETARILARVKGYNVGSNYTCSKTTQNTINMFKKSFPQKWGTINKDYENCIAYLYEKEIFTISDLDKFVTKSADGAEKVNNLKREDMAAMLVKTMDKKEEAIAYKGNYVFSDDESISDVAKPYVYYLKSLGVVSGDANGRFNPNSSITKAEMAAFLDRAIYSKENVELVVNNNNNAPAANNNTNTQNITVTSDEGKIANIYTSTNVIGIINSSNQAKAYRLSPNVKIYLDGLATTIDKLATDMPVVIVLMNNEATEIRAQKITVPVTGQVGSNNTNNTFTNNTTNTPILESQLITRICTVSSTGSINNAKTISVIVQMVNPSGDIYKEEQTFILSKDCVIKRGTKDIELSTVEKDDIVTLKINGNNVYSIFVEEKNMTISGAELIEKRVNDENTPILTIKTKEGTKYDLKVTSSSEITRKGEGTIKWQNLRIGDTIDVDKQYNVIKYLYATGYSSTVEGSVDEIVISDTLSSITLKDSYGTKTKYSVFTPSDLYSITLDSKVKLVLDSKEVESIRLLSTPVTANAIQGTIDRVGYDYIDIYTQNKTSIRVTINDSTTIYDAVDNKTLGRGYLSRNWYVNITYTNSTDKIAKIITVMSH